jgi:hypothetical protein
VSQSKREIGVRKGEGEGERERVSVKKRRGRQGGMEGGGGRKTPAGVRSLYHGSSAPEPCDMPHIQHIVAFFASPWHIIHLIIIFLLSRVEQQGYF